MVARRAKLPRLLILVQSSPSLEATLIRLKAAALDVTLALTSDSAVALCLSNQFAAVVLDAALIRKNDWTVAQSLKLINPSLPIVLLNYRSNRPGDTLPPNIDVLATYGDLDDLLSKLRKLLLDTSSQRAL